MPSNKMTAIKPNLRHFLKMTDDFGFVQFAKKTQPDENFGYSIDDQARALIVMVEWYNKFHDRQTLKLAQIYLNFIERMIEPDGFHNFVSIKRRKLKEVRSQDAIGRTFWALGYTVAFGDQKLANQAKQIFERQQSVINKLKPLRSQAFSLLGLCYYRNSQTDIQKQKNTDQLALKLANNLVKSFAETKTPDWLWFEDYLVYSNAILPYSLLIAYQTLKQKKYLKTAQQSFDWLLKNSYHQGLPTPIGADGWFYKGKKRAIFRQQPIDVADMVIVAQQLFIITNDNNYRRYAIEWFNWFLGKNLLIITLYDKNSGGCRDGLFPTKVNPNEGAESTIMFWMSYLALIKN